MPVEVMSTCRNSPPGEPGAAAPGFQGGRSGPPDGHRVHLHSPAGRADPGGMIPIATAKGDLANDGLYP
jgi:hypothetical protein